MRWITDHWVFLALFAGYTALLALHAWEGQRRTRGLLDYYVGGRTMGGVAIGLSFFATYSSTNSYVGFAGQAYSWGLPWLLLVPCIVGFSLVAWVWIAPRLREFAASLDSVTIPDFIGFRFGSAPARFFAAAIVLVASFFYMTAVFKGAGELMAAFLNVPYSAAIAIVFLIVMLYTAIGGFISVVRTDVVQGIIMVFAAAILFAGVTRAAGGVASFFAVRARPESAALFSWNAGIEFPVLLGILFAGTIKFVVEPRQLSRFYGLADRRAVRHGMWVSTLAFLFVYSLLVPIGIYARNIVPTGMTDTDRIVPALLTDPGVFHPAASAFLLVAMVAAAMSSLDSVLLVMASTFERDLVGLVRPSPSEGHAIRATRLYVVLFSMITAVLALEPPGGIVTLTAFSGSLYAACFLPAIVLGLYWHRGNGTAVLASFAAGLGVLLSWKHLPAAGAVHEVFPALLLSTGTYVLVALAGAPNAADRVAQLFPRRGAEAGAAETVAVAEAD
ncbi:MAG: hypothetical protein HY704_11870 [Gemmatimonadetes bacterium]|nr:hypothetical protein [Gemmatimonadota bacterium]